MIGVEFVTATASTLTATGIAYVAKMLHDMRDTTTENERRSVRNMKAIRRQHGQRPPATPTDPAEFGGQSDDGGDT